MKEIESDPFDLFAVWYRQAGKKTVWRRILTWLYPPAVIHQPDAMILSTANRDGKPSARVVLFKGIKDGGFTFFTNYMSQKGRELTENPRAELVFHWAFPERQVRVEGVATKTSREASVAYWRTRPRGSQLSGAVSPQSSIISGRAALVKKVDELKHLLQGADVPCPEWWGGFCLIPDCIEFWEGRANRLHERIRFTRNGHRWNREFLAP
ncbi:MAG: pyridoxamine 5'-phosphate oxidase [Bdellovibrionota bacterium]